MKRLDFVTSRGYSCEKCYDKKTFGEKFIFYLLKSKNVNFVNQLSKNNFDLCGKYRYDFYLTQHNTIIEVNGYSHNNKNIEKLYKINRPDLLKKNLAINNGILYKTINYTFNNKRSIEIDIIKSLKDINFEKIYELSNESFVFRLCESWNKGKPTLDISNELYIYLEQQ